MREYRQRSEPSTSWGHCGRWPAAVAAVLLMAALLPAQEEAADEVPVPAGASEALQRAMEESARDKGIAGRSPNAVVGPSVVYNRRIGRSENEDPVYRNGVPYYDDWTVQAGATLLRVPAYPGWESVRPRTDFFQTQANAGSPGEHLSLAIVNKGFMRALDTKFANFFVLLWVPQEHAFKQMTTGSFAAFKEELQEKVVADRESFVERDDFDSFEDYINLKFGRDEAVEEFADDFMIRAIDQADLVTYFVATNMILKSRRSETVEPMIVTVSYALVEEKLIRFDMKRVYNGAEDVNQLLEFAQVFVRDMRRLNALSASRGKR